MRNILEVRVREPFTESDLTKTAYELATGGNASLIRALAAALQQTSSFLGMHDEYDLVAGQHTTVIKVLEYDV